jgi:hypothetical protein
VRWAWLCRFTLNRIPAFQIPCRERPVAGDGSNDLLTQLEDPASKKVREWDLDHQAYAFNKLLALVKGNFEPATRTAFPRCALDDRQGACVAASSRTVSHSVHSQHRPLQRSLPSSATLFYRSTVHDDDTGQRSGQGSKPGNTFAWLTVA